MANLNDILQGLVTTDNKVINKLLTNITDVNSDIEDINNSLTDLNTKLNDLRTDINESISDLQEEIDNDILVLEEKVQRGSGSYAIVDINTPEISGSGTKESDLLASHGECYALTTSSSTNYCLYSGVFSDVKYGHYALCARVKIGSTTSASSLVQLKVLNGSTEIVATDFSGSVFKTSSQYYYLYTTFTYEGSDSTSTKDQLTFQLHTHLVDGIKIYFDYAYISMIIPAVFI